jgi:hypothetical protein
MKEERTTAGDDDFDEKLFQSMLRNGAAFPTTPEEVRDAKARLLPNRHPLPERLRDASIVCKKILSGEDRASDNVVPMPPNEFAEVKQELARAARNGKEALSSKVEERMRMNRARAKCSNG